MNKVPHVLVVDSGIGGLSIFSGLAELQKQYRNFDLSYFADYAFCPYSSKSTAVIRQRTEQLAKDHRTPFNADYIIVACNTLCTLGLDIIRQNSPAQVIGVVPPIKPASEALARPGQIAVIATPHTARSDYLFRLIAQNKKDHQVWIQDTPLLVIAAENLFQQRMSPEELKKILEQTFYGGKETFPIQEMDALVLGCTHFSLLKDSLQNLLKPGALLFEPNEGVVNRFLALSQINSLDPSASVQPSVFYTSEEIPPEAPLHRALKHYGFADIRPF